MKRMTFITAITLGVIVLHAQPLPQQVEFQEMGLSFDIPQGWQGQMMEDAIVLGHQTLPGIIIITENLSQTTTELKNIAMKGVLEEGIRLQPIGDFRAAGKTKVEGYYEGDFNGSFIKCYAQGLINGLGSGMNIFVLTEKDKFTVQHELEAKKLANSVNFFESKDAPSTKLWKKKIVGRQLKYMHTSGEYDTNGGGSSLYKTITIDLCVNGQFTYYNNTNYAYDTGEPAMDSGQPEVYTGSGYGNNTLDSQGNYKLFSDQNETYLELHFYNGDIHEYVLATDENHDALLNGERYFITDTETCY